MKRDGRRLIWGIFSVFVFLIFLTFSTHVLAQHAAEDHKGFFIQGGAMGTMGTGIGEGPRLLDLGPGAFLGVGYNFGILGVRTSFHYGDMDGTLNNGAFPIISSDLYGGSVELKISPLGERDTMWQPYIVMGAGASYFETASGFGKTGDWGFTGNGGIGLDIFIMNGLAITLETNLRPSVFYQSTPVFGANNTYDIYFYDFMGGLTWVFGAKAKETKVTRAPPPPPPPPPPTSFRRGETIELKGRINFDFNSAKILSSAHLVLDDAVRTMKKHSEITLVTIGGYTDSRGADAYNLDLSQKRADAVRIYFVENGIDSSRLEAKGYGEANPIASNDTREGRAKNRRIVFRVTEYEDSGETF